MYVVCCEAPFCLDLDILITFLELGHFSKGGGAGLTPILLQFGHYKKKWLFFSTFSAKKNTCILCVQDNRGGQSPNMS